MGNLLTSLFNSANALRVYSQALQVTENNVVNASTPGYAKQVQTFVAQPFDVTVGLPGGVQDGPVQSARSAFAEQSVRNSQSSENYYQQLTTDLTSVQNYFDVSGKSGISSALDSFFSTFSQLSINPNDTVSRQAVLDQAQQVATTFQDAANGLIGVGTEVDQETRSTVVSINQLASDIATINGQGRIDPKGGVDAGVDAKLNNDLEQLSQLTNFTVLQQPDGSVSVYLGDQTPLVLSNQSYAIQADFSNPKTAILDQNGNDITSQVTQGQLAATLSVKNASLPSYLADLNNLASSFADQVNSTLAGGIDQNGAAPVSDLFSYNVSSDAAETLSVNPLTPDQIAAALPGATGGNGNALNVAALAKAKTINGYTFDSFYGNLSGRMGQDLSTAQNNQDTQQQLLTQAQTLRSQVSGVSLDEEAANLLQFQQAYQAVAKMLQVLNTLTDTVINNLIPS